MGTSSHLLQEQPSIEARAGTVPPPSLPFLEDRCLYSSGITQPAGNLDAAWGMGREHWALGKGKGQGTHESTAQEDSGVCSTRSNPETHSIAPPPSLHDHWDGGRELGVCVEWSHPQTICSRLVQTFFPIDMDSDWRLQLVGLHSDWPELC